MSYCASYLPRVIILSLLSGRSARVKTAESDRGEMARRWCLWRWRRKIGGIEFGGGVATERAVTGRLIETQIGGGAARPEHKHTTTQNDASRVATAHHCHGDINESPPSVRSTKHQAKSST